MIFKNDKMLVTDSMGYTVLEVIVAIFIFGCISTALFRLTTQTDRLRGRVIFVEHAVQFAANEAERLRNIAAENSIFEDSSYAEMVAGRTFSIERHVIKNTDILSAHSRFLEPAEIELIISDAQHPESKPLRFKLLMGSDRP